LARCRWQLGQTLTRAGRYDEARAELRRGLELWETLYKESPAANEPLPNVANVMFALCDLERRAGTPAQALEWFEARGRQAEPLTRQNPPAPGVWLVLRNAYWGQAEMLTALGRFPEALTAWEKAIDRDEGGQKGPLRLQMLVTLAQTGDYAKVAVV